MSTYDYVCDACGHEMELFQSITASAKKKCPACEKNKLRRLIGTGGAVLFKGSGFYETDYRSEGYKKAADKDKPESVSEKKSDSKNTDSKPAKTKATGASDSKSSNGSPGGKPASKNKNPASKKSGS